MIISKQQNEQRIFNTVYGDKAFISLTPKDKPDFWVSLESEVQFGVEITELFKNESEARLQNIPNYTSELLDRKGVRHKDDKEHLIVDEVTLISDDGTKVRVDAIIQKSSTLHEHLTNINNRLVDKNDKFANYKKDLEYINLIVYDSSGFYSNTEIIDFYNLFFNKAITSTIYRSGFREIYYVATLKSIQYVFPLKRMLLVSSIFFFQEVLIKASINDLTEENYYYRLSAFLLFRGALDVIVHQNSDNCELIFGNTGFILKDAKKITLRDYGDAKTPKANLLMNSTETRFVDIRIQSIINEVEQNFGFETELGFPSKL